MSDPKAPVTPPSTAKPKAVPRAKAAKAKTRRAEQSNKAQAAALVKRTVPVLDAKGKPTGKTREVRVGADEVFAYRHYGDRVVVVTTDGQKLTGKRR